MDNPLEMTVRELVQMMQEVNVGMFTINDGAGEEGIHCSWCLVLVMGEDAEQLLAFTRELDGNDEPTLVPA